MKSAKLVVFAKYLRAIADPAYSGSAEHGSFSPQNGRTAKENNTMTTIDDILKLADTLPQTERRELARAISSMSASGADDAALRAAAEASPVRRQLLQSVHAQAARWGVRIENGRVDPIQMAEALKGREPEARIAFKSQLRAAGYIA